MKGFGVVLLCLVMADVFSQSDFKVDLPQYVPASPDAALFV
jgi:hypothetical protein